MKYSNAYGQKRKCIKTRGFKILYASVPLDKLKDVSEKFIKKVFHDKSKRYLVNFGASAFLSNKVTFIDNELIEHVNLISDNSYIEYNSRIYRQVIGIPMLFSLPSQHFLIFP